MAAEENRIRLKIDMRAGTVELEAPPGDFEQAIQKTKDLAETLQLGKSLTPLSASSNSVPKSASGGAEASSPTVPRVKVRASGGKASTGRAGRLGSFTPIRELLTEEQHQQLHAYTKQKNPTEQEEQILVVVHKGEQLLQRQGFNYNEIYTLLWRAGVEPLPKAIDVVVQRLVQDQRMDKNEAGFFMKFLGQSYVDKSLPRAGDNSSTKSN